MESALPASANDASRDLAPPPSGEPAWVDDFARGVWKRLAPYAAALRGICFTPRRFGQRWAEGQIAVVNPATFFAGGVAVISVALKIASEATGEATSFHESLLLAVAPQLYFAAFGGVAHGVLRALGSRRRLRTSVGLALYAGGGWATASTIVLVLMDAYLKSSGRLPQPGLVHFVGPAWVRDLILLLTVAPMLAFYVSVTRALQGAHQTRGWKPILAVLVATPLLSIAAGFFPGGVPGVIAPRIHLSRSANVPRGINF